ncbi:MAG: hypothetical protein A2X77_01030 [Gammaproteobacteria bacterium GWE2_42_36]|nr:MAG: hypothetical protein A2X77_01030 [Gammaproteobacteria bacterium GWE2_42_36]
MFKKMMCCFLWLGGICFACHAISYTDTFVRPVTWSGEKWEYLIERPAMVFHVNPVLFEEILDTAGVHGWKLMDVTSEAHAYTFYFARPLLPHKMAAAIERLKRIKEFREDQEAAANARVQSATQSNSKNLSAMSASAQSGNVNPSAVPVSTGIISPPVLPTQTSQK